MPKLFIPACGDQLVLTAPWRFRLFLEHRNKKFAQALGLWPEGRGWDVREGAGGRGPLAQREAELPAGAVVECDRIYVRQYNRGRIQEDQDYDSVTWKVAKLKGKEGRGRPSGRFWVKLPDVYEMEYELRPNSLYRDRVKLARLIMET